MGEGLGSEGGRAWEDDGFEGGVWQEVAESDILVIIIFFLRLGRSAFTAWERSMTAMTSVATGSCTTERGSSLC